MYIYIKVLLLILKLNIEENSNETYKKFNSMILSLVVHNNTDEPQKH